MSELQSTSWLSLGFRSGVLLLACIRFHRGDSCHRKLSVLAISGRYPRRIICAECSSSPIRATRRKAPLVATLTGLFWPLAAIQFWQFQGF
jgi:hypothetical protein